MSTLNWTLFINVLFKIMYCVILIFWICILHVIWMTKILVRESNWLYMPYFNSSHQKSCQIKLKKIHVRQHFTLKEKAKYMYTVLNIIVKVITLNVMTKISSFWHTRHQIYHPIMDHQVDQFVTRTKEVDTRIIMSIASMTKVFGTRVVRNLLWHNRKEWPLRKLTHQ